MKKHSFSRVSTMYENQADIMPQNPDEVGTRAGLFSGLVFEKMKQKQKGYQKVGAFWMKRGAG
ncbi:hypothetical protein COCNU_scaffold000130G000020 [Cocos nucifera]|nr:hypothetical protein [Cocos nucifera]